MNLDELMKKKRRGDIALVAEMLGESLNNTDKILRREKSKKHLKAVEALQNVILTREAAIEDFNKEQES